MFSNYREYLLILPKMQLPCHYLWDEKAAPSKLLIPSIHHVKEMNKYMFEVQPGHGPLHRYTGGMSIDIKGEELCYWQDHLVKIKGKQPGRKTKQIQPTLSKSWSSALQMRKALGFWKRKWKCWKGNVQNKRKRSTKWSFLLKNCWHEESLGSSDPYDKSAI